MIGRVVLVAGPWSPLADAVVSRLVAEDELVERASDDVDRRVQEVVERHGRLDAAVNLPSHTPDRGSFDEQPEDLFDAILAGGARWTFRAMRAELRAMVETGGAIVNLASSAGLVGVAGSAIASAIDHAIVGLTRTAALEFGGRGIRVNAVCPAFAGEPGPLGAVSVEQVASSAVWLTSPLSGAVTGTCLQADGGLTETEGQLGKH